jgi:hypothetical protein
LCSNIIINVWRWNPEPITTFEDQIVPRITTKNEQLVLVQKNASSQF